MYVLSAKSRPLAILFYNPKRLQSFRLELKVKLRFWLCQHGRNINMVFVSISCLSIMMVWLSPIGSLTPSHSVSRPPNISNDNSSPLA